MTRFHRRLLTLLLGLALLTAGSRAVPSPATGPALRPLLSATGTARPVLLLIDNSASMHLDPASAALAGLDAACPLDQQAQGVCPVGAYHPDSRAQAARRVALGLAATPGERFAIGLLAFTLPPAEDDPPGLYTSWWQQWKMQPSDGTAPVTVVVPVAQPGTDPGDLPPGPLADEWLQAGQAEPGPVTDVRDTGVIGLSADRSPGSGALLLPLTEAFQEPLAQWLANEQPPGLGSRDALSGPPLTTAGLTATPGLLESAGRHLSDASVTPACMSPWLVLFADGPATVDTDGTVFAGTAAARQAMESALQRLLTDSPARLLVIDLSGQSDGVPALDAIAGIGNGPGRAIPIGRDGLLSFVQQQLLQAEPTDDRVRLSALVPAGQPGDYFRAWLHPRDGSGRLEAIRIDADGEMRRLWDADTRLPVPSQRALSTWRPDPGQPSGTTLPLQWDALDAGQRSLLARDPVTLRSDTDAQARQRLRWLQGERPDGLRQTQTRLGGFGSSPGTLADGSDQGYAAVHPAGAAYTAFLAGLQEQPPVLLWTADDGRLHGFDGRTPCGDAAGSDPGGCGEGGRELFAHVPASVWPALGQRADGSLAAVSLMDSRPAVAHVHDGRQWRRLAIITGGRFGDYAFAFDIDRRQALWEIGPGPSDPSGRHSGDPAVALGPGGRWLTVVPTGGGVDGRAGLLFVDSLSGERLRSWQTPDGQAAAPVNAMGPPLLIDLDGDRKADRVYAGDLLGRLWRLDLDSPDPATWGPPSWLTGASGDRPLFEARDRSGAIQSLTVRPSVQRGATGQPSLLLATGRYRDHSDRTPRPGFHNSLYGFVDDNRGQVPISVDPETATRTIDRGWVLDLPAAAGEQPAARVIHPPLLTGPEQWLVTALVPSDPDDPCATGGRGFLLGVNPETGAPSTGPAGRSGSPVDGPDPAGTGPTIDTEPALITPLDTALAPVTGTDDSGRTVLLVETGDGRITVTRLETAANRGRLSWRIID